MLYTYTSHLVPLIKAYKQHKTTHATHALVSFLRPPLLFTSFARVYDCETQPPQNHKTEQRLRLEWTGQQ